VQATYNPRDHSEVVADAVRQRAHSVEYLRTEWRTLHLHYRRSSTHCGTSYLLAGGTYSAVAADEPRHTVHKYSVCCIADRVCRICHGFVTRLSCHSFRASRCTLVQVFVQWRDECLVPTEAECAPHRFVYHLAVTC
jgi:hypothetical protein